MAKEMVNYVLYQKTVANLTSDELGQLVRLTRGMGGNMIEILADKQKAIVYLWKVGKIIVSWASVTNSFNYDGKRRKIKEINIFTHKNYRKMGFGWEIINAIKTDYPREFKKGKLWGYGDNTSLIRRADLRSF